MNMSDYIDSARAAGLRYVSDTSPGLRRVGRPGRFSYRDADGNRVTDSAILDRIGSLAIPPAWTQVWICPLPTGHVQATGRDARGRKQYRYHPRWNAVRDQDKFDHLLEFGRALPRLRRRVQRDLGRPGLPREKVVALVVRLLESTLVRVGNEEYAQQNRSFGLTTLRGRHAEVGRDGVKFVFRGKHGVEHAVGVRDRRLARVVKQCQDLPGQALFQYRDGDGMLRRVDSGDVNEYLRAATGRDFTAKDIRTWSGTVLAAQALAAVGTANSVTEAQRNIVGAIDAVAAQLGNTRAVCRRCYVHPAVLDAYAGGRGATLALPPGGAAQAGLRSGETALLDLLRRHERRARAA